MQVLSRFVYTGHKNKEITFSYWQLPPDIMENPQELTLWVEKSVEAAKKIKKN